MLLFVAAAPQALSPVSRAPSVATAAPINELPNVVTPLLPKDWKTAQDNSRVRLPGYNDTELFSGFFTIDEKTNSNTYFMFSKAMSGRKDAPVIAWLNGGPGASSLLGARRVA